MTDQMDTDPRRHVAALLPKAGRTLTLGQLIREGAETLHSLAHRHEWWAWAAARPGGERVDLSLHRRVTPAQESFSLTVDGHEVGRAHLEGGTLGEVSHLPWPAALLPAVTGGVDVKTMNTGVQGNVAALLPAALHPLTLGPAVDDGELYHPGNNANETWSTHPADLAGRRGYLTLRGWLTDGCDLYLTLILDGEEVIGRGMQYPGNEGGPVEIEHFPPGGRA